jgi:hypothetical protein
LPAGGLVGLALGKVAMAANTFIIESMDLKSFSFMHVKDENWIDWGPPIFQASASILVKQDGFFWGNIPTGVKFGSDERFLGHKYSAIFTNTSKLNYVPSGEAEGFFTWALKGKTFTK